MAEKPTYEELEREVRCLRKEASERKKVEVDLRQSREEFAEIFCMSLDMICIADIETASFIKVNPAFTETLGFSPEELVSRSFLDFVHPDDMRATVEVMEKKLKAGQNVVNFTNRYLRKDGSYRWLEWVSHPAPEHGITFAVAHDVTEQKRVESRLKQSESRFRALFENMYDGVAVYVTENDGEDFRFVDINEAGQRLSFTTKEAVLGKRVTRVFPGVEEIGLLDVFRRVYRTGKGERLPLVQYRDDRMSEWVDNTVYKLPSGEIVAVYRDDSERQIAESELRKSEKKFRALFQSMNEGVCLHKLTDDGEDYEIVDVNPAFESFTGLSRETAVGKKASRLYGTGKPPFIETYRKVAETQKPSVFETHFEPMDKYFRISCFSLEKGFFATVFADITEQKRIENEIRLLNKELEKRVALRTAELQEANKDMEGFVYSVSHDLRAPLRAIGGFSQIIARRHSGGLNEEGRHYFDNIVKASERMDVLIEDLLAFSRLGRRALKRERIDLDDLFRVIFENFEDRIQRHGVRIDLSARMPVVRADRTLLSQILGNLIDNGIKYRREGVNPSIDVAVECSYGRIVFRVEDNGIGIAPECQEKIFDIFQRLHREEDYSGTGIGLAAARKAARMMGGDISVRSEPGKGSVFIATIPESSSRGGGDGERRANGQASNDSTG